MKYHLLKYVLFACLIMENMLYFHIRKSKGYGCVFNMIKNYIFDFGNVLCEFNPQKLTGKYVTDPKDIETVSEVVFDRLYWDKLDMGTIEDEEVKSEILKRLSPGLGTVACRVYDNWVLNLPAIKGMESLVKDIHAGGSKLYLLSSISKGFARDWCKVKWIKELFELFDGLVLSGTIGMVKPNKDIFEHLLSKYSLNADECIFIDDSQKNIDGAKSVGINGYLFDGDAEKLKEYLGNTANSK